jgi:hypothetical protein
MSRRSSSARAVVLYTRPNFFFLHLADSHTTDTYVLRVAGDDETINDDGDQSHTVVGAGQKKNH